MREYLLATFAEECNEVMTELHKNINLNFFNEKEIIEINDFFAVIDLIIEKRKKIGVDLRPIYDEITKKELDKLYKEVWSKKELKEVLYNLISEIQFLLFKSIRFGFKNIPPEQHLSNEELIRIKIDQFLYITKKIAGNIIKEDLKEKKKEKVIKFSKIKNKDNKRRKWADSLAKFLIENTTTLKVKDLTDFEITVIEILIYITIFVIIK